MGSTGDATLPSSFGHGALHATFTFGALDSSGRNSPAAGSTGQAAVSASHARRRSSIEYSGDAALLASTGRRISVMEGAGSGTLLASFDTLRSFGGNSSVADLDDAAELGEFAMINKASVL